MAMSQEQKMQIAQQLAQKRQIMGDSGFSAYLNKVEQAIPQQQAQSRYDLTQSIATVDEPKGVLGFLGKVTGVSALGRGAAAGLNSSRESGIRNQMLEQQDTIQTNLVNAIQEQKKLGKDTSRLEKALQDYIGDNQAINEGMRQRADLGVTNREVIGSAIRTAGTIASAGTFGGGATGRLTSVAAPKLTSATTIGQGALQGSLQGLKTGAASGAIFGGVSGVASGVEQNKGVLGTAFEAAKQAAVGGVLGGAVGTAVGGVGGAFQARSNRAQELKDLLGTSDNVDDALLQLPAPSASKVDDVAQTVPKPTASTPLKDRATAGFTVQNGKVVADKKAQALLKQGVQDTDVAIMQSFSPQDAKAAREMVNIAKETARTGIPNQRQQEVVGRAFMQRAKDVETINRTAGGQIDDIARSQLAGKPVNASKATDSFFNQLERDGVDIDTLRLAKTPDDVARAFEGSSYEGLTTVQRTLKTVINRVDPDLAGANLDGLQLHRAKRFIDNQVTYGKNAEGLVGDAERLLKGLRANIDDVLDTTFPDYNVANTQYRDTIEALDEMRRLIGKDYLGSGNITDLKAGEAMDKLLGKATAKPMSALQNLENVSRKYGNTYSDSIVKQIRFADLLDDIYETVPKGSLQGRVAGGVAQGVDQGVGFMNRMRQGGLISATLDTAGDLAKSAAGVTPEARQKAVEEFLGLAAK